MRKDLVIVTADQDAEFTVKRLLQRELWQFNIGPFTSDVIRHTGRDSGCRVRSKDLLRDLQHSYRYAVVLFDFEGCEPPRGQSKQQVAAAVELDLSRNGWAGRNKVVLIDPELENWIWMRDDRMAQAIRWVGTAELYGWLEERALIRHGMAKPPRPKESLHKVLRQRQVRPSASQFEAIAQVAPLRQCTDPAFLELIGALATWFPLLTEPEHGEAR